MDTARIPTDWKQVASRDSLMFRSPHGTIEIKNGRKASYRVDVDGVLGLETDSQQDAGLFTLVTMQVRSWGYTRNPCNRRNREVSPGSRGWYGTGGSSFGDATWERRVKHAGVTWAYTIFQLIYDGAPAGFVALCSRPSKASGWLDDKGHSKTDNDHVFDTFDCAVQAAEAHFERLTGGAKLWDADHTAEWDVAASQDAANAALLNPSIGPGDRVLTAGGPGVVKSVSGRTLMVQLQDGEVRSVQAGAVVRSNPRIDVTKRSEITRADYPVIFGDQDRDRIPDVDDPDPTTPGHVSDTIEETLLSNEIGKLIDLRGELDHHRVSLMRELEQAFPRAKTKGRTKSPFSILNKLLRKRLISRFYTPEQLRKLADDVAGGRASHTQGLTDMVGTMVVAEDYPEVMRTLPVIMSGRFGKVLEHEDKYAQPVGGYRAHHFLVERGRGFPVELQLKTRRQSEIAESSHKPFKHGTVNTDLYGQLTSLAHQADQGDRGAAKKLEPYLALGVQGLEDALTLRHNPRSMTERNAEAIVTTWARWAGMYHRTSMDHSWARTLADAMFNTDQVLHDYSQVEKVIGREAARQVFVRVFDTWAKGYPAGS